MARDLAGLVGGGRCAPSPPGSSPSTTPPWCPGSTSTGGSPSSGPWRAGECPLLVCTAEAVLQRTPAQGPCWRGPPGCCAWGRATTSTSWPRPSHRRGLHPVRAGGGCGPVRPAGGHSGLLLPVPGQARAGGVLRRRDRRHGSLSTRTPSGGWRTSARRRSSPPPRCCPSSPPAALPAWWSCWTAVISRAKAPQGERQAADHPGGGSGEAGQRPHLPGHGSLHGPDLSTDGPRRRTTSRPTRWWCSARAPGWRSGGRTTCGSSPRTPRP